MRLVAAAGTEREGNREETKKKQIRKKLFVVLLAARGLRRHVGLKGRLRPFTYHCPGHSSLSDLPGYTTKDFAVKGI